MIFSGKIYIIKVPFNLKSLFASQKDESNKALVRISMEQMHMKGSFWMASNWPLETPFGGLPPNNLTSMHWIALLDPVAGEWIKAIKYSSLIYQCLD